MSSTTPTMHARFHADGALPALRLVRSPRGTRRLAQALVAAFILLAVGMLLLPWQQTASGTGQVTAFSPLERPQAIPAPIPGRIVNWFGHREGSRVKKDEVILEIEDNDPDYLARLASVVDQAKQKVAAAKAKVAQYEFQITELETYRDFTVLTATNNVESARADVRAAEQKLRAAQAELMTAELNYNRKKPLAELGYESGRTLDLATLELTTGKTDLAEAQADLEGAKAEVAAKQAARESYEADADAKIAKARAERDEAVGEVTLAEKDLLLAQRDFARQSTQDVRSPCDGTILRLQAAQAGEQVKVGEPLFLVVPDVFERAVELWVDGNDATLVERGRKVRLVFEGFPGIQFAGWPSVAVGTFGGVVDLVDATDNGQGMFRILVVPDESDDPWPGEPYLRQGVKVNGWILLNRVPLWFEVWRRLNGFPPVVGDKAPGAKDVKKMKKK